MNSRDFFSRQVGHYRLGEREGKRGVDYFRGLLPENDEKENYIWKTIAQNTYDAL